MNIYFRYYSAPESESSPHVYDQFIPQFLEGIESEEQDLLSDSNKDDSTDGIILPVLDQSSHDYEEIQWYLTCCWLSSIIHCLVDSHALFKFKKNCNGTLGYMHLNANYYIKYFLNIDRINIDFFSNLRSILHYILQLTVNSFFFALKLICLLELKIENCVQYFHFLRVTSAIH